MTAPELRVLRALPVGRPFAVSNRLLAEWVGLSQRAVQHIVQDLRLAGKLVCSSSRRPAGFYMPADKAESEAGIAALCHRLAEQSATVRAMEGGHAARYGPRQLQLQEVA